MSFSKPFLILYFWTWRHFVWCRHRIIDTHHSGQIVDEVMSWIILLMFLNHYCSLEISLLSFFLFHQNPCANRRAPEIGSVYIHQQFSNVFIEYKQIVAHTSSTYSCIHDELVKATEKRRNGEEKHYKKSLKIEKNWRWSIFICLLVIMLDLVR